ncbi:UNVERIFIED_CONTAM: hypothetical protein Slati_3492400 [Sesamum latifolium]|uniref:Integrase zinc-binding domain-containing protein n=1 Tax=Sesamum latifolium TaxID=2727402 RepID=A0AAW2UGY1_9LAMI
MKATTLNQAITLARKQESDVNVTLSKTQHLQRNNQLKPSYRPVNKAPVYKPSYKPSHKAINENSQPKRLLTEAGMIARKEKIIKTMHGSALGGHSRINRTLQRWRMLFYRPAIKEEVHT